MTEIEKLFIAENETLTYIQKLMAELGLSETEMVIALDGVQNRIKGMALTRLAYNNMPQKDEVEDGNTTS